jgi:hypothetical protein
MVVEGGGRSCGVVVVCTKLLWAIYLGRETTRAAERQVAFF